MEKSLQQIFDEQYEINQNSECRNLGDEGDEFIFNFNKRFR